MALKCITGFKECDGCMNCQADMEYEAICEQCGCPIFFGDAYYELPGKIIIHEDCLKDFAKPYRR